MRYEKIFRSLLGITDPQLVSVLADAAHEETLPKGHSLVAMGEIRPAIHFLLEGYLRGYIVDENGRDFTDCFITQPGDVVVGCGELSCPSPVHIETITECRVLTLPMDLLLSLLDNPALLRIYNCQLQAALSRHWEVKMMLYRFNAMERYQWFLQRYPDLENHISGKHLASFLGITPVTLSRLRRQLKNENAN